MFSTATNDQVLDVLVRALSPYVGPTMASASVRGLCQKLALDEGRLGRAQITTLLDHLAPGLHVYLGKEKTQTVVGEIWKAIDALGGNP